MTLPNEVQKSFRVFFAETALIIKFDSNLKDLRVAALCSLAFARFFRYNELSNILSSHIDFHVRISQGFLCCQVRQTFIEKVIIYISVQRELALLSC